jgi:prepilin-type N-terminal cleavage/methylation domain-containing protein
MVARPFRDTALRLASRRYRGLASAAGFTLIELIVVISVMLITLTIALPSFVQWTESLRYREVSRDIASKLRSGRQMAVSNNLEYRLEFDIDGRQYRLVQGNLSSGSTDWTEVVKPWKSLDPSVAWATGGSCGGTADMNIEFNPNGTASSGTTCIQDRSGVEQYRVEVTASSGRVRIE